MGVDPPGDALLVRVLEAEVVYLHDVQLAEDDLQQFAAQRSALKHSTFVFYTIQVNDRESCKEDTSIYNYPSTRC